MPKSPTSRTRRLSILTLALAASAALPAHAQTLRTDDPVLRTMWTEGMERSQTEPLAQALLDSIGPRLSGSPGFRAAVDWLVKTYRGWGIEVRPEQYGTWRGWRQGAVHVDLVAPRVQTLDAKLLAWSPGTKQPIDAPVVAPPAFASAAAADAWLRTVKGKIVLISAPEPSCREPQALERLATPETYARLQAERQARMQAWTERFEQLARPDHSAQQRLEDAGAVALLSSTWSSGWGVNKIFGTTAQKAVALDLSCEDYGLVARLAERGQGPRLRIDAQAEFLGNVPMFNVVAELKGTELPNEYVVLSAHLDSWAGAQGATDNGTGTIMMMEAMRILKAAYPKPRRTILVGHWGGEEQGLRGSRSFTEDHPEVVKNLQVLFNQDNGTWRIEYIEAQGLLGASTHLARWYSRLPLEISRNIKLGLPGQQENPGSDHSSFLCHGAPGWRLQSSYPDYRQYTWHTNLDTYDKIVFDDLKNNATLAAMLAYLASEDPERVPRDRALLAHPWPECAPAKRSYEAAGR